MEGWSEEWQEERRRRRRRERGPRVSEESTELLTVELSKEVRLKYIIDGLYEGVLSEPDFSIAYAKVCYRLHGITVPTTENPGVTVNFRKLLLNRCQKDFEIDKDDEILKQMKELDAATEDEERQHLTEELEKAKEKLHRRSLGNIKFIGELFKLNMLTEPIMHDCIVKLIKSHDEEKLECFCTLLSTVGKNLDFEKAKPRMDQYFNLVEKIIKEGKISSRISLMLQEILDLRWNNWVPRSSDQGPTAIDQDHKEAELMKNITGHVKLLTKTNSILDHEVCRPQSFSGRMNQHQDRGWNKVPISRGGSGNKPSIEFDVEGRSQGQWRIAERPEGSKGAGAAPTPEMFERLLKQLSELNIDTEERLKGVVDMVYERSISQPNFSAAYANLCLRLIGIKVPTSDNPEVTVNFRNLLLNRCQKEFEKDKDSELFEQMKKELGAATEDEEHQSLTEELEKVKEKLHRRSLGNIKFIGELFKLNMLTEAIMHDCIVKLIKSHDEERLECFCTLLSTVGKKLDYVKAKPRVDQYFSMMGKFIKEGKVSSRISIMLQELLDLRWRNWIPRGGDQGPKMMDEIYKGHGVFGPHFSSAGVNRGLIKIPINCGGPKAKPSMEHDSGRSSTNTLSRFIAPHEPASSSMYFSSSVNCKNSDTATVASNFPAKTKAAPDFQAALSERAALVTLLQSNSEEAKSDTDADTDADAGASVSPPPAASDSLSDHPDTA